jgi:hypothetical protein
MSPALRETFAYFDCHRPRAEEYVAEYMRFRRLRVFGESKMRIAPIPPENVVHGRNLPSQVLRIRRNDGDLPVGPADVVFSSGRQAEQRVRLTNLDPPIRSNLKLVFVARHQSADRGRRMVNSMAPSGSSRHRSTWLM